MWAPPWARWVLRLVLARAALAGVALAIGSAVARFRRSRGRGRERLPALPAPRIDHTRGAAQAAPSGLLGDSGGAGAGGVPRARARAQPSAGASSFGARFRDAVDGARRRREWQRESESLRTVGPGHEQPAFVRRRRAAPSRLPAESEASAQPNAEPPAAARAASVVGPPASAAEAAPGAREGVRRKLLLLLDNAVANKMRVARAYPRKLAALGDVRGLGLDWHPGWRDPAPYVPPLDADPFRGACALSGCPCDMFETWPSAEGAYVYHPDGAAPEALLCHRCYHAKSEHRLATSKERSELAEFAPANVDKYAVSVRAGAPRLHPADVPVHELRAYYRANPSAPGASADVHMLSLEDAERAASASGAPADAGGALGLPPDEELGA